MTTRPLTRVLPAMACVVALLGVGATTACSSTPAASGKKVTIGYSYWPGWDRLKVAQEKGIFKDNGVEVELKFYDNYTDSLTALIKGEIDANAQTLNDTIVSVSSGAQQKVVLVNDNSTGNDKIIAADGITSVADLKGKKVAVEQGTVDHYLLLLALEQVGLTERDITLKGMGTEAAATAFAAGEVDAVGAFAPFTSKALDRPGSRAIATSAEFPGAIPDHIVFNSTFITDRPGDVQRVVNAWFDTLKWIKSNRDAAIEIMATHAKVNVAEYKSYDAGTTIFTLQQNLDAFRPGITPDHLNDQADKIADFLVANNLAKTRPSVEDLFDDRFVRAVGI